MDKLPVVLMRFSAWPGSMSLSRWYSPHARQLFDRRKVFGCEHTIVIVATVAEVLLKWAVTCREVVVIVRGVVRV